jgi:hypothetical protein
MKMKGLTVQQPYASLIAIDRKHYETRSRHTKYRGLLAIHAGKSEFHLTLLQGDPRTQEAVIQAFGGWSNETRTAAYGLSEYYHNMPYGKIVAVAELVECWQIIRDIDHALLCKPTTKGEKCCKPFRVDGDEFLFGDYRAGRYAWELANVKPLADPIPFRGQQGLWNVPPDIEQRIMELHSRGVT